MYVIIIIIISSCYMTTIIFDMDGVLVESMSYHYQAMKTAIKEVANINLDKRTFYLFEGMPIAEMALEILKQPLGKYSTLITSLFSSKCFLTMIELGC